MRSKRTKGDKIQCLTSKKAEKVNVRVLLKQLLMKLRGSPGGWSWSLSVGVPALQA
jgi:hypothetical protein